MFGDPESFSQMHEIMFQKVPRNELGKVVVVVVVVVVVGVLVWCRYF